MLSGFWRFGNLQKPLGLRAQISFSLLLSAHGISAKTARFFDIDDRLKALLAKENALEKFSGLVDFERFLSLLRQAIPRLDGSKGGRPAYDLEGSKNRSLVLFCVLIAGSLT